MATAASIAAVQKAYVAYYGRPADPSGLDYWANRVDNEGGIDALIGQFGTSAEAATRFGSLSQSDAIDALYQQIFGRAAEAAGKSFYLNGLLRGDFTLVTIAQNIIDGASGSDATVVANKLSAAQSFTDALDTPEELALYSGDNASANARNWLSNVDSTEASVTAATGSIDSTVAVLQGAPSNPGSVFSLTSAASDVVSGTVKDDTYNASTIAASLQTGDSIVDPSTDDNDVLNAAMLSTAAAPKLTNVETINLSAKYVTGGIDLANVIGTDSIVTTGGLAGATITVSGATTLAASELSAGTNVANLKVFSSAAGTRDEFSVDFGAASGSVTGGAGVDVFSLKIPSAKAVTLNTFATSGDKVTVTNADGAATGELVLASTSAMGSLVVAPTGDYELKLSNDPGSGITVLTTAGQNVTLNYSGTTTNLNRLTVQNSGQGTLTLDIGSYTGGATDNLGGALVDTILMAHSGVGAGATTGELLINQMSTLKIADQIGTAVTVGLGTGTAVLADDAGALNILLTSQLNATTSSLLAGSSVGTLNVENGTGTTVTVLDLQMLSSSATVLNFMGENAISVGHFSATDNSIVTAANLTASLSISAVGTLQIYGGENNDTISFGGSSATIYGMGGNDTITSLYSATTILAGDGDDIVNTGAGNSTVTLGAGSDTLRINLATTSKDTVSDFVVGTDKIAVYGAGTGTISVAAVSGTTTGVYSLVGGVAGGSVTLTGNTATDFTNSLQLGYSLGAQYSTVAAATASVTAGSSNDFLLVTSATAGGSYTLGDGADTLELVLEEGIVGGDAATASRSTVTDFVVGQDVIVLTGTATVTSSTDAFSADVTGGVYTFGASSTMVLKYGGSNLSETNFSTSLRFGHSGSGSDAYLIGSSAGAVGLGNFDDFVTYDGGSGSSDVILTIKDGGGLDTIHSGSVLEVRYALSGISTDLVTGISANAAKVANTIDGSVYVFESGADGASTSSISFSGAGSAGAAGLTGVATFLEANLGGTTGEKLLAVINDQSGLGAYTYLISNTEGAIDASDLTLITIFDGDGTAGQFIHKADLS